MKINLNKVIFLVLASIAIALGCFASAVSLLTQNIYLQITLLTVTYLAGILLVKVRKTYPLWIKK